MLPLATETLAYYFLKRLTQTTTIQWLLSVLSTYLYYRRKYVETTLYFRLAPEKCFYFVFLERDSLPFAFTLLLHDNKNIDTLYSNFNNQNSGVGQSGWYINHIQMNTRQNVFPQEHSTQDLMSFPSSDSRFNRVDWSILIVGAWTQTVAHE